MKKFLLNITGNWWLAALIGIGLLGWAGYAMYQAKTGGAVRPAAELKKIAGKVEKASEVTVERKGRRGRSRGTDRYYELEVAAAGATEKVRIGKWVNQNTVREVVSEDITAMVDADDHNIAYGINLKGRDLIRYEETAKAMQAAADANASSATSSGTLGFGVVMLLIGAAGFFLNKKLLASIQADEQHAA